MWGRKGAARPKSGQCRTCGSVAFRIQGFPRAPVTSIMGSRFSIRNRYIAQ